MEDYTLMCYRLARIVVVFGGLLCLGGQRPSAARWPTLWSQGLTDQELAISRWFSHLTSLQDLAQEPWPESHNDGKQLGITSLRYQLAFAGYGCAAMATA